VNRAVWDLTYEGAEMIPGAKIDLGAPVYGPLALPVTYTVKLNVNGASFTSTIKVLADPRVPMTVAELRPRVEFALALRDQISRLTRLVMQLRLVRQQLSYWKQALGHKVMVPPQPQIEGLITKLELLEANLHNPKAEVVYDILGMKGGAKLYSRMSALYAWTNDSDGPVTEGMRDVLASEKSELDQYDRMERIGFNG